MNIHHEPIFLIDDLNEAPESEPVAIGGNFTPELLLKYYSMGIFPWGRHEGVPLWYCPQPRWVLFPEKARVSRSMQKILRRQYFQFSCDKNFEGVISNCQTIKRRGQDGTWLDDELLHAFLKLYRMGYAHSIEVYYEGELVGGLYGLYIGKIFFGESMFFKKSNASKAALIMLCQFLQHKGARLIDCQSYTPHLESMGAVGMQRSDFLNEINNNKKQENLVCNWTLEFNKITNKYHFLK
ncbi:MAG: leucyl/phenylalanyl-tRNA--protein transferase [Bacteroidia bacterium]|nr:leucyl/phenylalanyl-tRNA--protein transferase [Bacteroidia bacterium]